MTSPTHVPFQPTQWSLILSAAGPEAHTRRRGAMEQLARTYWPPLYAFLRRDGHPPEQAQDLVQEFFSRLLEKHALQAVDPARGKFRSFLLASLKNFLANEWDKAHALKRGGRVQTFSLSPDDAESRLNLAPADTRTPDQLFDQQWALTLLHAVIDRLRGEYAARGQQPLFDALQGTLTGERSEAYAAIAKTLDTTEGALQIAAHRLRKRYREILREEIAQTVADPAQIDDELRDLFNSL